MALFQKKPEVTASAPAYTIGANRTVLVIGLGNPGKECDGTRHNIGFATLDRFAASNDFPGWLAKQDLQAAISSSQQGQTRVILVKPTTYMNDSGRAVSAIQRFYRVYNQDTLVVYDELAIPFGQLRSRLGGSDAGHNGIKSLIQYVGDDFRRLRIGIGSEDATKLDTTDFVLQKFSKAEQASLEPVLKEACAMMTEFIYSGELPHETRSVI